jgi:sulfonate transport system ATP-binding protein
MALTLESGLSLSLIDSRFIKMTTVQEALNHTVQAELRFPLTQVSGVSKRFAGKWVLRGIDLEVAEHELVVVVGRSGCGKSTLLRLLAGLETASQGQVFVNGQPMSGPNRVARLMFQDSALLPWKTVLGNVRLAAPRGGDGRSLAIEALGQVGLADRAKDWPSILSGGQQQRVALARALASKADLLLLDEPLGALDALTRLEMQALIEKIWLKRRFSVVLVTHDVEEAAALADRVLVMEQGQFVFEQEITLARPRIRSTPELVEVKDEILRRVMAHPA